MHGHWDINEADINKTRFRHDPKRGVNMGISVVVPAQKILETINHNPGLVALRETHDREISAAIAPSPNAPSKG
jgi:hypothetical protein